MNRQKWLKWSLMGLIIAVAVLAFIVTRPDTYLPHQRIVLQAPYDPSYPPDTLLPMGEKVDHPNAPLGHPGIDIQWQHRDAEIVSATKGKISKIKQTPEHYNNWDIEVVSWPYLVRYKELQDYDTSLKVGSKVEVAQFIGHPGWFSNHAQMHWEFGSVSLLRDRFCPMTYFAPAVASQLEEVWVNSTPKYKAQYPDICSGGYKNKTE